jgi:thiamine-phosphate pyrophosphorylase
MPGLEDSRLYLITDARDGLTLLLERAIAGGVDVVQIREKALPDSLLLPRLEAAREVTARYGVPFIVNDRPDLACLVGADFVHVGQDDLPVEAARTFAIAVGQSTHAEAEIACTTADYIGVGPVFATPTKQGRAPVGLALVQHAAKSARCPWFAIGGIDLDTIDTVLEAGAKRVAVVRAIAESSEPESAARALCSRIERFGDAA